MIGKIKIWENDGKRWEDRKEQIIEGDNREKLFVIAEKIAENLKTEIRLEINDTGQGHYIGSLFKFEKIFTN